MINPFRRSILFGAIVSVVSIAILVGVIFIFVTAIFTASNTAKATANHLEVLLDTVESSAGVACFVEDKQLASELVAGLLKSPEVSRAVVRTTNKELASGTSRGDTQGADVQATSLSPVSRTVMSPFSKGLVIGEIMLEPNSLEISRIIHEKVSIAISLLALQLLFIVTAVVLIVIFFVVRPIRSLSANLHSIDAKSGEKLLVPKGHEHNEIAVLTNDINSLMQTIVDALTDEQQCRIQLEVDEQKYHNIFENSGSGIFIANEDGHLTSFNRAFSHLTGINTGDSGSNTAPRLAHAPWKEQAQLLSIIEECVKTQTDQVADLELDTIPVHWLRVTLSAVGKNQVQGVVTDVTQGKESEAAAIKMVVTDKLTGLSNRVGLERYIPEVIRQKHGEPMTLMLVDIKGFKHINESMGVTTGDQVLKVAATRLMSCVKSTDKLARIGKDEFAVILHGVGTQAAAERVARRIVEFFNKTIDINGTLLSPKCNIGVAFYPGDGNDFPTMLRNAALAHSIVKLSEAADYLFFKPDMVVAAEQRYTLELDLRQSIHRGELRVYYQAIVELQSGRVVGAEALIRWEHPQRGLVVPDAFIPIAESTGFIKEIGVWVAEEVCKKLAAWRADQWPLYISINVSSHQIPEALPVSLLTKLIQHYDIPAGSIVLEITESAFLADFDKGVAWAKSLREVGFRIYMDDFGTGYSSLSYLKNLPVNTIKVDKSFIRDLVEPHQNLVLVQAIIAMAEAFGLDVVAEGIENEYQKTILKEMDCGYGQGYLFSKPVPAEQFEKLRHISFK